MKHEIKKLNQLKHTDSFMQVNYLRGFKYVDKAGEIVNSFFTDQEEPPYQMTPRELIIKESSSTKETYRVAVNNMWVHDSDPQNLENLERNFQNKADSILKILGIEEIFRTGWRNYFIYELHDPEEKRMILSKFVPVANSEFSNLGFQKNIDEVKCKFLVKGAEKRDENKTPAIIFDIDCYRSFDSSPIQVDSVAENLKRLRTAFNSQEMLDTINSILTASGKMEGKNPDKL